MFKRFRRLPSPPLVISVIALALAVGGGTFAIAALSGHDKRVVKRIAKRVANKQIKKKAAGLSVLHATSADTANSAETANTAKSADTAANAQQLGGVPPSGYQGYCKAGSIKGSVVLNTMTLNSTFQNVGGFDCFQPGNTTTSVQAEREALGQYVVRFVGNSGADQSGSAVCSLQAHGFWTTCQAVDGGVYGFPGEKVFRVIVTDNLGNGQDNFTVSLIAF